MEGERKLTEEKIDCCMRYKKGTIYYFKVIMIS